jgi:membrane protease YdiL (CAAX protease family)
MGRVFFGFFLWFGMTILLEAFNYFTNPEVYEYTFNAAKFLPLLVIALLLLPIQTSFEEFLFRGYLMQGIGLASSHKWIPLVITSIMFGLIHSMNPEVQEFGFGTMQVYYISAGLLLGILTVMDDGMELSLGVHAATNIYGALMVGYQGAAIQTETIFRTSDMNPGLMTVVFLVAAIAFIFICAKKYNWPSFTKLMDQIILKEKEDYV